MPTSDSGRGPLWLDGGGGGGGTTGDREQLRRDCDSSSWRDTAQDFSSGARSPSLSASCRCGFASLTEKSNGVTRVSPSAPFIRGADMP